MRIFLAALVALAILTGNSAAFAQRGNNPATVQRLPRQGIPVPAENQAAIEAGLAKLAASIAKLQESQDAKVKELLPDVLIYHKAVHDALKYQEFHAPRELAEAMVQLSLGQDRADNLLKGEAPWTKEKGLVVRGYISKIDQSVQPYGLVVPESYTHETPTGYRCDVWLHGRAEMMTELNFIRERRTSVGTFSPPRTLVLHPYGRWNNAFKLAGEVDVFESLTAAKKAYAIDDDRIAIRGFSMGGAGVWHLAVHYPDVWFAANPGAGFSESPQFLRIDPTRTPVNWWEQTLWHLYNCNDWATNIAHVPTVAYSGEIDGQKQAADVMAKALREKQMELVHVIGPQTGHSYHPIAKVEVDRRLAILAAKGRNRSPQHVSLTTYSLKYPQAGWVVAEGLGEHWKEATVTGGITKQGETQVVALQTKNITDFRLESPPGDAPISADAPIAIVIDGQRVPASDDAAATTPIEFRPRSDGSWLVAFHKADNQWKLGARPIGEGLRKTRDLQGPIDDAFMDAFVMVRPTGKAWHESVEKWTASECDRAIEQWRRHFRGEAQVRTDADVKPADLRGNLVLWGDPSSNAILAQIADKLPIKWTKEKIIVDKHGEFPADTHALIAVYPNPLNSKKYIVINSGFTFREFAHLNNARQIPVLPDWAVVDLTTPPSAVWPGKIAAADFFDEAWQLKKSQ